jgi:hypothetical protein
MEQAMDIKNNINVDNFGKRLRPFDDSWLIFKNENYSEKTCIANLNGIKQLPISQIL